MDDVSVVVVVVAALSDEACDFSFSRRRHECHHNHSRSAATTSKAMISSTCSSTPERLSPNGTSAASQHRSPWYKWSRRSSTNACVNGLQQHNMPWWPSSAPARALACVCQTINKNQKVLTKSKIAQKTNNTHQQTWYVRNPKLHAIKQKPNMAYCLHCCAGCPSLKLDFSFRCQHRWWKV